MQAALTAAERGHEVILCEKTDKLGGVLNCEASVSFKRKLHLYLEKQALLVSRSTVDVRLDTEVTPELILELKPDAVIAALRARAVVPDIPGIRNKNVFGAEQAYANPDLAGHGVVILGGGLAGVELAVYLSELGREVTIVELQDKLNYTGARHHGFVLDMKIRELGIKVLTGTQAVAINARGVAVRSCREQAERLIPADTVIYAVGLKPEREKADALRACALSLPCQFHQIGDCLAPKNILEANQAGYHIARDIGKY
jgi:pyruvate/2-oxoglutarate dehydrogenase complex dihydrolipoamide dehydrogenase (E3) component